MYSTSGTIYIKTHALYAFHNMAWESKIRTIFIYIKFSKRILAYTKREINTSTYRESEESSCENEAQKIEIENAKQRDKKVQFQLWQTMTFSFIDSIGSYSWHKKNCTNCILLLENMKTSTWPMFTEADSQTKRRRTHHS